MKRFFILSLLLLQATSFSAFAQGTLPRLKASGNHLEDEAGKSVTLRGVSLCSLDWHKPLDLIKQVTDGPQSWPVNVIRLPVQAKEWRASKPADYLKHKLDPAVEICSKSNVYCIIDWHEIGPWDTDKTAKELEQFWNIVAIRYSRNPNILYEVFNEPTSPGSRNAENWAAWKKKMDQWIAMIRKDAPDTLILAGSPHWSQMPSFAVENPLEDNNVAYVMHLYPNWKQKQWPFLFGNASANIPIFLTEWGWSSDEKAKASKDVTYGTLKTFGKPFKDYLSDKPNISWTAWSYDPLCGPAMLGADKDMADFVHQWLKEENAKN